MSNSIEHQMINSPFKWVGGKSRFRKQIISVFPEHSCYVELFSGAAWVLFGKAPSSVEVLNDIDTEVVNFFRIVKYRPEELINSFEWELVSRNEFERLAALNTATLTDLERAHRFYYILMAGWGGELHSPRFQTSITDRGHGNRLIGALKFLRERIEPVYNRLQKVVIENMSWEECFKRYDRVGSFMYIDPPYPENKCHYAHNMRSWDEHQKLADTLQKSKCKWALSLYDNPQVRELYKGCNIIALQAFSGMRIKTESEDNKRILNMEVLITNYEASLAEVTAPSKVKKASKTADLFEEM